MCLGFVVVFGSPTIVWACIGCGRLFWQRVTCSGGAERSGRCISSINFTNETGFFIL